MCDKVAFQSWDFSPRLWISFKPPVYGLFDVFNSLVFVTKLAQ